MPTLVVLDLKDAKKQYTDIDVITASENYVCDFYQSASVSPNYLTRAKKIHDSLKNQIDFVICEGTLKHDLLKDFSEPQAEWLLSKNGGLKFCQYTEFYMNGFKFGQESNSILAEKYIKPISTKFDSFQPLSKSTVWYPSSYKNTYAPDGHFMTILKTVFSVDGELQPSGITAMSMEVKPS